MGDLQAPSSRSQEDRTRAARVRSPANPGINLETALARANEFYQNERRNPAPFTVAVSHWGFGPKSSGGLSIVAALKAFGLMKELERGQAGRTVQLTDLALRILLDTRPNSIERDAAAKEAALRPRIHAELWKKYKTAKDISDGNLRHELIFTWRFNENTVDDFIREYRETLRFAKLEESDTLSVDDEDKEDEMTPGSEEQKPPQHAGGRLQPQISTPVGKDGDQIIFAQVQFNAALKREYVAALKKYLDYLETTLQ